MPAERVLPTDLRLEVSSGMLKSISKTVLDVRWLLLSWVAAWDAEMTLLTDLQGRRGVQRYVSGPAYV